MSTLCKYLAPVVISASNGDIYFTEDSTPKTATITPGTYYFTGDIDNASDICKAIETAMTAVSTEEVLLRYNADKTIGIMSMDVWTVDWDNAATTFDGTLIGIADLSAAFGALQEEWDNTDHQHKHAWYSTQPVEFDSRTVQDADATQSVAKSGATWTVQHGGPYTLRTLTHNYEPIYKAFSTSGYENQAWQDFWEDGANAGQRVRFYPDVSSASYFDAVLDEDTCRNNKPARYAPGVELYGWTVGLRGYVA